MENILGKKKISGFLPFVLCIVFTLGLGTLSGFLSGAMKGYDGINVPAFAPPDWVFSVVWTVLYIMLGISLYLILSLSPIGKEGALKTTALVLFAIQFALNLLWPFIFFNVDYTVAFVINAVMVAAVTSLVTIGFFIRPLFSVFLLPYWGWLLYAAYQTLTIIILNA